jgi:hypothetical protein
MHDRLDEAARQLEELADQVVRDLTSGNGRMPPHGPSAGADSTIDWLVRHRPRAARWLRRARRWRTPAR